MINFKLKQTASMLSFLALNILLATSTHAATQHAGGGHAVHWGYTGSADPSKWGGLSNEFALCGSGKRQSPVDIRDEKPVDLYTLRFQYQSVPLRVVNNGHTLQADYGAVSGQTISNSTLMLGDVPYKLLQFHFHTPSEHARKGERYAMEAHLVHKNANGNLAVVGVLLKRGAKNPTLQKLLDNVSGSINEVNAVKGVTVNAADLLPRNRQFFYYSGSLTTPPCSENVNWLVMNKPMEASEAQINSFTKLIGKNARPLQSVHWRSMLLSE